MRGIGPALFARGFAERDDADFVAPDCVDERAERAADAPERDDTFFFFMVLHLQFEGGFKIKMLSLREREAVNLQVPRRLAVIPLHPRRRRWHRFNVTTNNRLVKTLVPSFVQWRLGAICGARFRTQANSDKVRRMSTKHDSDQDAFERDWNGVLENYEQCRRAYQAALDADAASKRVAARAYWHAIGLILHCYNRPGNWNGATRLHGSGGWSAPRFAFPPALAKVLANQAEYLSVGQLPAPCADVLGKGRTAPGPHEKRDRAIAVAMVAAIKAGEIDGKIKDVASTYGVTVRTLQKWSAEMEWVLSDTFGAPEELRAAFAQGAERHRLAGRSESAITKRAQSSRREPK